MLSVRQQISRERDIGISEGTVFRPSSTALLTVDSADRFKDQPERRAVLAWTPPDGPIPINYSAYNFRIAKNESIMNGFFTRLAVSEVVFPWIIPNINIHTDTITVKYDVGLGVQTRTLKIINAFRRPFNIGAYIQLVVRTYDPLLAGFTMEYSPSNSPYNNCFVYSTGNASTIAFEPIPYVNTYSNDAQTIQLFDLLGFVDVKNTVLQPAQSSMPTLCQFTRYVDIICPQLTYNQSLKDTSSQRTVRDALCRVYLGTATFAQDSTVTPANADYAPPGCAPVVLYYNYAVPKQIQWQPNQAVAGYLEFQVYDDNGVLLSEMAQPRYTPAGSDQLFTEAVGVDWSMTLLVSEN